VEATGCLACQPVQLADRQSAKSEAVDRRLLGLQGEVADCDERLRRLYRSIEDGIVELDDILRERTVALKSQRERAKAAFDHARAQCRTVTTIGQVSIPTLTGMQHARFAVLCAREAYAGGSNEDTEFGHWADGWLSGQDASGIGARAMAAELQTEAERGSVAREAETMMVANAARSAMHAAGLSLRGGREHTEETARAIQFATEAVRTALRMADMDLPSLADQAVDSGLPRG